MKVKVMIMTSCNGNTLMKGHMWTRQNCNLVRMHMQEINLTKLPVISWRAIEKYQIVDIHCKWFLQHETFYPIFFCVSVVVSVFAVEHVNVGLDSCIHLDNDVMDLFCLPSLCLFGTATLIDSNHCKAMPSLHNRHKPAIPPVCIWFWRSLYRST